MPFISQRAQIADNTISWQCVEEMLSKEMDAVMEYGCSSLVGGPLTASDLDAFSVSDIQDSFKIWSPHLWSLLETLVRRPTSQSVESTVSPTIVASLLLKSIFPRADGLQLLMIYLLMAKGTQKQVITTLNHLDVCLS